MTASVSPLRHYVYRCWSSSGQCLYVGRTTAPRARFRDHREKAWFEGVSWVETTEHATPEDCAAAEVDAIKALRPVHNRTHNAAGAAVARSKRAALAAAPDGELISLQQAADRFGVNVKTVRRWIASNRLEAYRMGPRLIRVRPDDVAALFRPVTSWSVAQ